MADYQYQVQSSDGKTSSGVITAESANAAAATLRGQGVQVMSLLQQETPKKSISDILKALNYTSGPSQYDILGFTTQLAVMIRAGISIRQAIEAIATQAENPKFRKILMRIKSDVESGKSFSDALGKHPKLFNTLYVNMVRASEMSGSFSSMLDRIADYMGQQIETKAMVRGAMIYPSVIFIMAVGTTIFLLTFVLPQFAMVFEGNEDILPWPTIFLMNLSSFMVLYWHFVIVGMVAFFAALFGGAQTKAGALFWHRSQLMIPVLKNMFRSLYISRSLHTMGELVNAGVPMLDVLDITAQISGNTLFKNLWHRVHESVQQGKKISYELNRTDLLPASVVQMVSAGEESGKLGEVLDEVSTFYSKRLKETIKTVTGLIEPIMIVSMGTVVGFIAMAIILPIFKISSLVK